MNSQRTESPTSDPTLEGKKVLIIEDEAPLRTALSDVFTLEGFTVFLATNGQEGLDAALKEKPDAILLDVVMPVMDGLTMLKKLREDTPYGATALVIILSNLNMFDEQVSKDVNTTEPALYLVKTNWDIKEVVKKVKNALVHPPHRS